MILIIDTILANWDFKNNITYKRTAQGYVNKNWIIEDGPNKYVLKELESSKKEADIAFEFKYLSYLKESDFPYQIPEPKLTTSNRYLVKENNHFYWMYKYIDGDTVEILTDEYIKQLALMVGNYHKLIEKSTLNNHKKFYKHGYNQFIKDELNINLDHIRKNSSLTPKDHLLEEYGTPLKNILKDLNETKLSQLQRYPIHRDLGGENIVWKNNKIAGVLDFENVSLYNEPLVKDLSVIIMIFFSEADHPESADLEKITILLDQYKSQRHLSNNELNIIPNLIISGMIEDFNYAYWMIKYDPERGTISRLEKYGKFAIWFFENYKEIANIIIQ